MNMIWFKTIKKHYKWCLKSNEMLLNPYILSLWQHNVCLDLCPTWQNFDSKQTEIEEHDSANLFLLVLISWEFQGKVNDATVCRQTFQNAAKSQSRVQTHTLTVLSFTCMSACKQLAWMCSGTHTKCRPAFVSKVIAELLLTVRTRLCNVTSYSSQSTSEIMYNRPL